MSERTYLIILKSGIFLSLITVFFVFKNLLFPYITSKQIAFNMLIEALFVFWLAFIIKYPAWRPRRSFVTYGLAAFFAATLLSAFTGVDFNLSFWGDVERMLGWFHIIHFFVYYLVIITVFRTWEDWRVFFTLNLIVAALVSANGVANIFYSTIGNTAYVGGYLIFNIYFALILFSRERHKLWRWAYLLPVPLFYAAFQKASISGAYVGLYLSLFLLVLIYVVFSRGRRVKIAAGAVFVLAAVLVGLVFMYRHTDFVTNNRFLYISRGITFNKPTFQTRLISWRAAWQDFWQHPVLGTGHGNYAIIFDKYFDPKFYNYTRSETYFDRAHNNVVDIASTTGALGIGAYLFIFGAAGYYLVRAFRRRRISIHEFGLTAALIFGYFVQNLAVFDSLVTYMSIMAVLGYVYWFDHRDEEAAEPAPGVNYGLPVLSGIAAFMCLLIFDHSPIFDRTFTFLVLGAGFLLVSYFHYRRVGAVVSNEGLNNREIGALFFAGLASLIVLYQFNYLPLRMLMATIDGQRAFGQGGIAAATAAYEEALGYGTVLDRDSRTSYTRLFVSNPAVLRSLAPAEAEAIIAFNVELAEANVAYNEEDSLNQMLLAQVLNAAAAYYGDDAEKREHYYARALEAINRSIASSPGRIPVYFQKAQIFLTHGDSDQAIETLKYAAGLNEDYPDSFCYLARTQLYYQQEEEGYANMDRCIDLRGAELVLDSAEYVRALIGHYRELEDTRRLILLYEKLGMLEKTNTTVFIDLAKLYAAAGDKEKAIEAAGKVAEIDPKQAKYAEEFINGL